MWLVALLAWLVWTTEPTRQTHHPPDKAQQAHSSTHTYLGCGVCRLCVSKSRASIRKVDVPGSSQIGHWVPKGQSGGISYRCGSSSVCAQHVGNQRNSEHNAEHTDTRNRTMHERHMPIIAVFTTCIFKQCTDRSIIS